MVQPSVLIISGYGLNCEDEAKLAFELAGAKADIIHVNDLIDSPSKLASYQIFMIPGGFSYGDDTGSGKALANKIRNRLLPNLQEFLERDTLAIGVCNGCQVLTNLGLVPSLARSAENKKVAVVYNSSYRYQCRWVDVKVDKASAASKIWFNGIDNMHIPVGHGEGNMVMSDETLKYLNTNKMIPLTYLKNGNAANGEFPYNPNGSTSDSAAISDETGRVIAMMPHPERGMFFTQRDDWPLLKEKYLRNNQKLPKFSDGIKPFENAVRYFG